MLPPILAIVTTKKQDGDCRQHKAEDDRALAADFDLLARSADRRDLGGLIGHHAAPPTIRTAAEASPESRLQPDDLLDEQHGEQQEEVEDREAEQADAQPCAASSPSRTR